MTELNTRKHPIDPVVLPSFEILVHDLIYSEFLPFLFFLNLFMESCTNPFQHSALLFKLIIRLLLGSVVNSILHILKEFRKFVLSLFFSNEVFVISLIQFNESMPVAQVKALKDLISL
jgi:hypothetical protein